MTMKRGLKGLAREVGVSPSYLCRVFKKTMGVTVVAYMMGFERELAPVKVAEEIAGDDEEGRKLDFDLDEWF